MLIYQTFKFWTLPYFIIFPLPKKKWWKEPCQGAIWLSSTELAKHKLWGASSVTYQGSNIHFGANFRPLGVLLFPFRPYPSSHTHGFFVENGWRISNMIVSGLLLGHFLSGTMIMGERWGKGNHVLQWKMAPRKERIVLEEPPWYCKMLCPQESLHLPNTAPPKLKKTPWHFRTSK